MDNQSERLQSVLTDIKHQQKSALKLSVLTIITIGVVGALLLAYSIFQVNRRVGSINEEIAAKEELNRKLETRLEAEKYIREGVGYAQSGKLSSAIEAYNKAINIDTSNAEAYGLLGYTLLRRGQIKHSNDDIQEAVKSLEHSVRLDSTNKWSHYNLALAYWEFGEQEKAIQSVKKTLALEPNIKKVIIDDVQFRKFQKAPEFKKLLSE